MRSAMAFMMVLAAAGCGPGDTRKVDPVVAAAPQPPVAMRETFATCAWGEVKGAAASIWSYACGPGAGDVRLVADDALPGFVIESTAADAPGRAVAIRLFDKPAEAPIQTILPAVRAASPGAGSDACVLSPAPTGEQGGPQRFVFAPEGTAKAAYEAAVTGNDVPEPPCGPLGVSAAGDRYFLELSPAKVAFIEAGSEIQIFDAATLTLRDGAHTTAPAGH